jgi:hypothetical protein
MVRNQPTSRSNISNSSAPCLMIGIHRNPCLVSSNKGRGLSNWATKKKDKCKRKQGSSRTAENQKKKKPRCWQGFYAKSHLCSSNSDLLAEWTGLEPATPGVTGRYSNQLNYHSSFSTFVTYQTTCHSKSKSAKNLALLIYLRRYVFSYWWVLTGSNR